MGKLERSGGEIIIVGLALLRESQEGRVGMQEKM
jgi:hypothetical protein